MVGSASEGGRQTARRAGVRVKERTIQVGEAVVAAVNLAGPERLTNRGGHVSPEQSSEGLWRKIGNGTRGDANNQFFRP